MRALNPETELAAVVDMLFRRWPSLVGFSITHVATSGLMVSNIEILPWLSESPDLFGEISDALRQFAEGEPTARELLRARTFARTLH